MRWLQPGLHKFRLNPGCPIFDSAVAFLECRLAETHDVGRDHDLMVGEVVGVGVRRAGGASDTLGLVEVGWSYAG